MWISKKKYEELVGRIEGIEHRLTKFRPYHIDKLNRCGNDIEHLQRIIENYIPGEVTYLSVNDEKSDRSLIDSFTNPLFTYFYVNGKEYRVNELYLHNRAKIKIVKDNENILYIEDEYISKDKAVTVYCEYTVDLQNHTFIRTKYNN